jgi:hypothetical protein
MCILLDKLLIKNNKTKQPNPKALVNSPTFSENNSERGNLSDR